MRLDDFGLQVMSSSERKLEALTPFLSYLTKSEGYYRNSQSSADTYRRSPFPVDQIVHQWVRANVGQRRQLVNDLFAITYSCTELSSAIFVLKLQVFRRGLKDFEPKFTVKCTKEGCSKEFKEEVDKCDKCGGEVKRPDEEQYIRLKSLFDDCNVWDQSLLEILKQAHEDLQIVDDCFIGLEKEFRLIDGKIHSRVIGISRLEPSLIEFDLSKQGLPKQNHWMCPVHRTHVEKEPKDCPECGLPMQAVMYKYSPYISSSDPQLIEQGTMYLLDEEVIHASKFHNSPTYGWSAILSMFEKVLTLIGMDKCYDEQTEVLTEMGWKHFRDLSYSDKLATRLSDGKLEYQSPIGIYDFPFDGKLYRVNNRFIDLLVTPHHRMYVKESGEKEFGFKEAKDIAGKPVHYIRGDVLWEGVEKKEFVLPETRVFANGSVSEAYEFDAESWSEYLGYWFARGFVCNSSNRISLSSRDLPSEKVEGCLNSLGVNWSRSGKQIGFSSKAVCSELLTFANDRSKLIEKVSEFPTRLQSIFVNSANVALMDKAKTHRKRHSYIARLLSGFSVNGVNNPSIETFSFSSERNTVSYPPITLNMDIWLEFLGYWLAEGHVSNGGSGVYVAQSEEAHRRQYEIIWNCLCKMPFSWHKSSNGFSCSDWRLRNYLYELGHANEKYVPEEFKSLSVRQLRILFDAWMLGDAGITNSEKMRDDFSEIALKIGMSTTYHEKHYPNEKWHVSYYMSFSNKRNCVSVNKNDIQDGWESYAGRVYCAEIPNGLLCVRRNGKMVWSGNSMFKYFFEREMPASILMVATDDSEGLRREREAIIAQTRRDTNYVPFMAYSPAKGARGRVDMVRLFHTLQEMDYLPVKNEIRERIAAMYGVTPIWQGSLEASGGISTQSMQIRASSMAAEADQRIFNEKVLPQILLAFNITDWKLELEDPEEKAESTKIQFALQRIQAANQALQMGFDVKIRGSGSMVVEDLDFEISGEAKKPDAMGGMGGFGGGMPAAAPEETPPEMYGSDYGAGASEESSPEIATEQPNTSDNMQMSINKEALYDLNKELLARSERLKKLTDRFLVSGKIPELPSPYTSRTKPNNKPEPDETEEEFE